MDCIHQHVFLLIGYHLCDFVLSDVDVRLDPHREVDPFVHVQQNCKGQKQGAEGCGDSPFTAIEGGILFTYGLALDDEKIGESWKKDWMRGQKGGTYTWQTFGA